MEVKRKILLNPGPATTTDSVKMAQIVPDICPREKEFAGMMREIREDLVRIVHGDLNKYTSVLFCGSGTICMDICLNSLLPENKKILVINNGAYSQRAAEICRYYNLPFTDLQFKVDQLPDLRDRTETAGRRYCAGLCHTQRNRNGNSKSHPRNRGACAPVRGNTRGGYHLQLWDDSHPHRKR